MENLSVRLEKKIFRYRYLLAAVTIGVILFGIIFPNSLSDHYHLLHFAAHFGMSFLIANSIYQFCTRRVSMKKLPTFALIFIAVLIFGTTYKFIEIFCFYDMGGLPFFDALAMAGFYASMSLNLSGMLASFAMAIYFDFLMPSVSKISQLKNTI